MIERSQPIMEEADGPSRLARRRIYRGVTQEEMARAIGVSLRTYRRLERGEVASPRLQPLQNCAIALATHLHDVMPDEWIFWTTFRSDRDKPPNWDEFWQLDREGATSDSSTVDTYISDFFLQDGEPWVDTQRERIARLREELRRSPPSKLRLAIKDDHDWPLISARHERGVTQSELADALGVSERTYRRLETDVDDPRVRLLQNCSLALGMGIYELFPAQWLFWADLNGTVSEPPKWEEFFHPERDGADKTLPTDLAIEIEETYFVHGIEDLEWLEKRRAALKQIAEAIGGFEPRRQA